MNDVDKIALNTEYLAKDQFGFRLSYVNPFIIVHLEIYDKNKKDDIIKIFKNFAEQLYEDNKEKGIKKVFIVDAEDVRKQISINKNKLKIGESFIIEVIDLVTGEFVPIISKIKELEKNN